jgi:hypothetical protein
MKTPLMMGDPRQNDDQRIVGLLQIGETTSPWRHYSKLEECDVVRDH